MTDVEEKKRGIVGETRDSGWRDKIKGLSKPLGPLEAECDCSFCFAGNSKR